MKTLFLSFVLAFSFSTFANEKGNGGDPFIVNSSKFPDQNKIKNAVKAVTEKMTSSTLGEELKLKLIQEAHDLLKAKKYLYLENIIVIGEPPEGYVLPQDVGQFLAFGAMTHNKPGENIYFSEFALKHTEEEFQKLLLHELLHHVLTPGLSQNENFIERLSSEIMSENISQQTLKALELRVFFTKNYISSEEIYDYFDRKYNVMKTCMRQYPLSNLRKNTSEEFCKKRTVLARNLYIERLPRNVSGKKIKDFLELSIKHFSFALNEHPDSRGLQASLNTLDNLRVDLGLSRSRVDSSLNLRLERFFGLTK